MKLDIPVDVLRLVFETASSLQRRSYDNYPIIARLMLVSKQVHAWLEPFLYHKLYITSSNSEKLSAALSAKSSHFIDTHVKTLIIHFLDKDLEPGPSRATQSIIAKCLEIERIELDDSPLPSIFLRSHHRPTALNLAIEDLSSLGSVIPKNIFKLDFFSNVTHLEFTSMLRTHRDWAPPLNTYGFAPNLTHLAFDESGYGIDDFIDQEPDYYPKAVGELLDSCSKLEMLVLLTDLRVGDLATFATYFGKLTTGKLFVLLDSWGSGGYNVPGGVWSAATKVDLEGASKAPE